MTRFAWLALAAVVLAVAPWAQARDYQSVVSVRDLEDLEELRASGGIDDQTFELLAELLSEKVSLNLASREELYMLPGLGLDDTDRIIHYRAINGSIDHPGELVTANILTRSQLRSIKPFLLDERNNEPFRPEARVRLRTAWSPAEQSPPTNVLQLRSRASRRLRLAAAAVSTRRRVDAIAWEAQPWFVYDQYGRQGVLTAAAPAYRVHLPKYFFQVEERTWGMVVGTYAAGFGQGVTFDSTGRRLLNGFMGDDAIDGQLRMTTACRESGGDLANGLGSSPCSGARRYERSLTDFRWTERQRGIAIRIGSLGGAQLDRGLLVHLWGSAGPRSVYQHDVFHTGRCPDPRAGDEELCSPPLVYRAPLAVGVPTTRFRQQQLPGLFDERLFGGHASYSFGHRRHVGVTGYAADLRVRIPRAAIDFLPSARYPRGGAFGALGLDGAWGRGGLDLFVEVAQTFVEVAGGSSGTGGLVGAIATWPSGEIGLSQRYYSRGFENPYGRGTAAADEYEGLRARNELGTRFQYTSRAPGGRLAARGLLDLWAPPGSDRPKLFVTFRADHQTTPAFRPGFLLEFSSDDLRGWVDAECGNPEVGSGGRACRGARLRAAPRVTVAPTQRAEVAIEYVNDWHGSDGRGQRWACDRGVRLRVAADPAPTLAMRFSARWSDEDARERRSGQAEVAASGEIIGKVSDRTRLTVRYDVVRYIDTRPSTLARSPNPEQWGRVDLEQHF